MNLSNVPLNLSNSLFRCRITSGSNTIFSNPAQVVVYEEFAPQWEVEVGNQGVLCAGLPYQFSILNSNWVNQASIQWYKNGLLMPENDNLLNVTFPDISEEDYIQTKVYTDYSCASQDLYLGPIIPISIEPSTSISIQVTATSELEYCLGEVISAAAVSESPGDSAMLTWFVNGTPLLQDSLLLATNGLPDSTIIYCELNSNAQCVLNPNQLSQSIIYIQKPTVTPSISINSAAELTVCRGDTIHLESNSLFAGNSPQFSWTYTGNLQPLTDSLHPDFAFIVTEESNSSSLMVSMTSNADCATDSSV